jgi:3-oxo-5alpha-steroid 4-dehydrogenase
MWSDTVTTENELIGTTSVQSPLYVGSADEVIWDDEFDVVVVGFGGAGVSAALDAAERGAKVAALDRFGGGGATAFSGGIYYASGTSIQREAGVTDSADEMFKYLKAEGTPMQDRTLRQFCNNSSENFRWVNRHVPYSGVMYHGKATYPPEGKFLYYSGNEKTEKFAAIADPAPRGHRAVGKGYTGNVFYSGLRTAALDRGVKLIPHCPVRRLVIDRDGAVIGVEGHEIRAGKVSQHEILYRKVNPHMPLKGKKSQFAIEECRVFEDANSVPRKYRARGGVILATGGFIYNLELLKNSRPDLAKAHAEILRLGSMGCDGSGIALGVSAGGYVDLMKNAFVGKTISPPEAYLHGILVNQYGARFINEDAYVSVVGNAIAEQPGDGTAYLVMDSATFWRALWNAVTIGPGMFFFWGLPALLNVFFGQTRRGRTPALLAKKLGIDAAGLKTTMERYNRQAKDGESDDLGKLPSNIRPIDKGPYYALNMSIHNKYGITPVFTLGGLRINEITGQILRRDGSSIKGLYAAGRTAVGMCSAGYMSGMSLADLVFSGRRASADVVRYLNIST